MSLTNRPKNGQQSTTTGGVQMSKYVMYAAVAVVALCNAAFSCSDGKPYVRPTTDPVCPDTA